MSDNCNDFMRKHEKTKSDYDKILGDLNEVIHSIDNAYGIDEKNSLKKKQDAITLKLSDADKKEKEAKRNLDECMKKNK